MIKVSIILTTYNHKDFIGYTIESITNQLFSNWELLIWDDSLNDDTWDIIQEYVKKYTDKIKVWHHNPNKWIVDNMNFLINKISKDSDFVVFLEWDDVLKPNYINEKLMIFEKYPDVNLVYNNIDFINTGWKIIQKDIFWFRHIKTYKNQIINCDEFVSAGVWPVISRSTVMVRRWILEKYYIRSLSPQNKGYAVSDYDFCFNVATENKVYYIDDSLTLYRRHPSNLSAWNIHLLKELSVLIEEYYKLWKISKKTFVNKLSQNNVMLALMCLEKWEKDQCFWYLKKSFKYSLFDSIILKLWAAFLLLLPLRFSKMALSRIVKRG
jgi:glycosyltransferase involved in cell wall biosynthesis